MIQVTTNTPAAVAANGALLFTAFKHRKGCTAQLNSGAIALTRPGTYMITANFSYLSTAAGTVTVTQSIDGTASTTDRASATAAAGDIVSLTIPSLVTVRDEDCNCGNAVLVGYAVNLAGTLTAANAVVTKVV